MLVPSGRSDGWVTALSDRSMMGLWMSKPLASGVASVTRKDGTISTTVAGFDFLLTSSTPFEAAEYDITSVRPPATTVDYSLPLDPDPVRLSDGTWRVDYGIEQERDIPLLAEDHNTNMSVCWSLSAEPLDHILTDLFGNIHHFAVLASVGFPTRRDTQ
jgi:hypothetical protein